MDSGPTLLPPCSAVRVRDDETRILEEAGRYDTKSLGALDWVSVRRISADKGKR